MGETNRWGKFIHDAVGLFRLFLYLMLVGVVSIRSTNERNELFFVRLLHLKLRLDFHSSSFSPSSTRLIKNHKDDWQ